MHIELYSIIKSYIKNVINPKFNQAWLVVFYIKIIYKNIYNKQQVMKDAVVFHTKIIYKNIRGRTKSVTHSCISY